MRKLKTKEKPQEQQHQKWEKNKMNEGFPVTLLSAPPLYSFGPTPKLKMPCESKVPISSLKWFCFRQRNLRHPKALHTRVQVMPWPMTLCRCSLYSLRNKKQRNTYAIKPSLKMTQVPKGLQRHRWHRWFHLLGSSPENSDQELTGNYCKLGWTN